MRKVGGKCSEGVNERKCFALVQGGGKGNCRHHIERLVLRSGDVTETHRIL